MIRDWRHHTGARRRGRIKAVRCDDHDLCPPARAVACKCGCACACVVRERRRAHVRGRVEFAVVLRPAASQRRAPVCTWFAQCVPCASMPSLAPCCAPHARIPPYTRASPLSVCSCVWSHAWRHARRWAAARPVGNDMPVPPAVHPLAHRGRAHGGVFALLSRAAGAHNRATLRDARSTYWLCTARAAACGPRARPCLRRSSQGCVDCTPAAAP